ncbi:hypothetical protein B0A49_07467 [Cryomyces minteri]|uniref:Uncharacterized protein n=1 Tax=Cryomyces minteri TaxID=331657 RepID=A0A4V5NGY9_9PEZI|nr:hypothetical protein B0A49_07467 [Cryomyces minteri]
MSALDKSYRKPPSVSRIHYTLPRRPRASPDPHRNLTRPSRSRTPKCAEPRNDRDVRTSASHALSPHSCVGGLARARNAKTTATMKRNIVIFLIIIILFVVLTIVGFLIYWAQNGFSAFGRRGRSDTSGEDEV